MPEVVALRAFTDQERSSLSKKGEARPGGSYPIVNGGDLQNAISAYGRAVANGEGASVKSWIIKRARELNLTGKLPPDWGVTASLSSRLDELELAILTLGSQVFSNNSIAVNQAV